ncbi:hypothetical protein HID58_026231 [Brassica napus]|uniref:non-specific serine/threonine protein kinase n=1 Tax=Brassica napus TaxID=3708 RepID=A0ABQ8CNE1_BRANA|nr:hypothetical protein HID58_026231 [Brassica napus]
MNHQKHSLLSMGSPPSVLCLILLLLFHHIPCVTSQRAPRGFCDTLIHCGNISVGFPFWGENRHQRCGHPSLKLNCNKHSNTTTLFISGYNYSLLHIDNTTNIIRLFRQDFSTSFCSASFSSAPLPSVLFQNLPSYKSLTVYYYCDPRRNLLGNFTCPYPEKGLGSLVQFSKYRKLCEKSFKVTVPTSYVPDEQALSLTHLESVLKKGFEVKMTIGEKFCQDCIIPGGHCGLICSDTMYTTGVLFIRPFTFSGTYRMNRSIVITFGSGTILTVYVAVLLAFVLSERRAINAGRDHNLEALVSLRQYSYGQIKRITKSFTEVVGRGGFGTVYKGNTRFLSDEITQEEEDLAKKMILIGLWCVQLRPSDRPSMNKVVEMMEGSLDTLKAPPKHLLQMQNVGESSQPSGESSSIFTRKYDSMNVESQ